MKKTLVLLGLSCILASPAHAGIGFVNCESLDSYARHVLAAGKDVFSLSVTAQTGGTFSVSTGASAHVKQGGAFSLTTPVGEIRFAVNPVALPAFIGSIVCVGDTDRN